MSRAVIIPLIIACALFMENIDATVITTSLPAMARDLHQDPISLKMALTAYVVVYFAVFGAGIFYLFRLMRRPPGTGPGIEEIGMTRTAGITPGPAEEPPVH